MDNTETRTRLLEILNTHFSESELAALCFKVSVDYREDLPPGDKKVKAIELIRLFERRNELSDLVEATRKERPKADWKWLPAIDKAQSAPWSPAHEAAYRRRIVDLYGTLRILGKPDPLPLEGVFTDVFILDKPTAWRRFDISQLQQDPEQLTNSKRVSGLELVRQPDARRLFILGKPGAGKTTFLKHVALQAAQGKLDRLPVFVSLKEWSDSKLELMPFLARQFEICAIPEAGPFIEQILVQGKTVVLFDGLDEVSQSDNQRRAMITAIEDFSRRYADAQILMTCRIAASEYTFEQFTYVELADFDDAQMRAYAGKWFKDDPLKRDAFLREFFAEQQRGLRELGRTPLLLALLCLNFDETMAFPQRRVEIYEEALEALLKKWDSSRSIQRDEIYRKLSLGHKRQLLAQVAFDTFEQGAYFIRQDDLAGRIAAYLRQLPPTDQGEAVGIEEGEAVLKAIEAQHGIFVERARHIYSFAHLSFQEYFTAKFIAEERAYQAILEHHLGDSRWREVFLQTASLLHRADDFFTAFKQAIDARFLQARPDLLPILGWAARKAVASGSTYALTAVRSLYIFLARAHTDTCFLGLILNLTSTPGGFFDIRTTRDRAYTRDRARASTLNIAHVLGFDLDLDLARALDSKLIQTYVPRNLRRSIAPLAGDLNIANVLIEVPGRGLAADFNLTYALRFAQVFRATMCLPNFSIPASNVASYFNVVTRAISPADLPELRQALEALSVPSRQDDQAAWQAFTDNLQQVMIEQRDIGHDWKVGIEQEIAWRDYLEANQLLVECLQLAVVSDRKAIEDSLLLPPGWEDTGPGSDTK